MGVPILTIKNQLLRGDRALIAKQLGCSYRTVQMLLNEDRGVRKTELQMKIIDLASKIAAKNLERTEMIKSQSAEA